MASVSLTSQFEHFFSWCSENHITFSVSKSCLHSAPLKGNSFSPRLPSDSFGWDFTYSVSLLGLSISFSLCRFSFISVLAFRAAWKFGFLFRTRHFFTPPHPLLCKAQIHAALEYYVHLMGGAPSTLLSLDRVQRKAIDIDEPFSRSSLHSAAHLRLVALLSFSVNSALYFGARQFFL